MVRRPAHLRQRSIRRTFGEDATLIRTGGAYNTYGEYTETEAAGIAISCATSPVETRDARARVLTEGGVDLDALRLFWTVEDIDTVNDTDADNSPGDIIVYKNDRYRARDTQRWNGFSETLGVRQ